MDRTDAELVNAAGNGDVESFRQLYEKYYGMAVGIARSRLQDHQLAEDAAQEAFAVACRKLHTLRNADRFVEWLGTICRRTANRMRHQHGNENPIEREFREPVTEDDSVAINVREGLERIPFASRE